MTPSRATRVFPASVRERVRRSLLWVAGQRRCADLAGRRLDPLSGRFVPYRGVGRRRLTLLMDATNRCNLRCVMCHFARPEARREARVELTSADLAVLEREILPRVKHAYLSAGTEPLMWKRFPELLDAWGLTDSPFGLERFALTAAEAIAGAVSVVKPQSAFFERHGAAGIAVLEKVVQACRDLGALVLLDVKRGDIGSTAQAYADAYLHPAAPLAVDAVTVSPYLGMGSLDPLVETALTHERGVFVLAMTSNPEAPQFQSATTSDGRTVSATVLDAVATRNAFVLKAELTKGAEEEE